MSSTHQVRFVEADCQHCHRSFPIPLLGDMSYGLFVLHGERGGVFGYLSAFECPSFEDIHSRLLTITGQQQFTRAEISRFQEVMAGCADEISGQPLGLNPVCPFCRSRDVDYGGSRPHEIGDFERQDIREIRSVTFGQYELLSEQKRTDRLRELWSVL
jgi:hypothetical protein